MRPFIYLVAVILTQFHSSRLLLRDIVYHSQERGYRDQQTPPMMLGVRIYLLGYRRYLFEIMNRSRRQQGVPKEPRPERSDRIDEINRSRLLCQRTEVCLAPVQLPSRRLAGRAAVYRPQQRLSKAF